MDEPLTNLDAKLREELRVELRELARVLATPVVWVTHDSAEALTMADRVAVLCEGRILQTGSPEDVYFRPASPVVAAQLGLVPMNVIHATRGERGWTTSGGVAIARASSASNAERAVIGFRPEHVELEGGDTPARVDVALDVGSMHIVVAHWGGETVHILVERGHTLHPGEVIHPRVAPEHVVVWNA